MTTIARNIGAGGRRLRLIGGAVFMAIGIVGAAAVAAGGAPRGLRLALLLPFYLGAVGILQARDHT
jgi:hypothetical protein